MLGWSPVVRKPIHTRQARVSNLTVSIGFYGKIPARGDFVRSGLPRAFIDAWDMWLQHMVAESRIVLAASWLPAWMEAPVWRFHLAAGVCGPGAALGVFMPSVDRAGRHFPLTLAAVASDAAVSLPAALGWLSKAEAAGIDAVADDMEPDLLADRLRQPDMAGPCWHKPNGACAWWTEGAPRVAPTEFATDALPGAALFARMLQDTPVNSLGNR